MTKDIKAVSPLLSNMRLISPNTHLLLQGTRKYWGQIYCPSLNKSHTKPTTEQQAAQHSNS